MVLILNQVSLFMLPLPLKTYAIGGAILVALSGWGYGAWVSQSYKTFKAEVALAAEKQKVIAEQTEKWNNKVIKDAQNDYEKRVAAINTKYGRLHYSCSSAMPDTDSKQDSPTTTGKTSNDVFAGRDVVKDCAITTNMLVTLQDILKTTKDDL